MKETFGSPPDYLRHCQQNLAEHDHEHSVRVSLLYRALTPRTKSILQATTQNTAALIERSVAIGALASSEVNAWILKSPDGKYAIVVHCGLMLLLNKVGKLYTAMSEPQSVRHCDRQPNRTPTAKQLRLWLRKLLEDYRRTGKVGGPVLQLHPTYVAKQAGLLHLTEVFVLGHELGHFLNGDLDNNAGFSVLRRQVSLKTLEENLDREIEHKADLVGYEFLELGSAREGLLPERLSFATINLIFDLFALLGIGESKSHPAPIERIFRVARHFHGDEYAQKIRDSYGNLSVASTILDA